MAAVEQWVAAEMAAGRHEALVTALTDLVRQHPLREALVGQLMLALYRTQRRADALAVYEQARRGLSTQLGLDPGEVLRTLHGQILRGDAALTPPAAPGRPVARNFLPYEVPDFTGRADDMGRLLTLAGDAPADTTLVVALDGMAGAGKTALALRAAHRLAPAFPAGQYFVDLHGHTPDRAPVDPAAALAALLDELGLPPDHVPAGPAMRSARWRAGLAGGRALVVLDNAAHTEQVLPLLPGAGGCLVLVTSRRRLVGLDGAISWTIDPMPVPEATHLLAKVAGRDRVLDEQRSAAEVVELCGQLPLAIRTAGARLRHRPTWTVGRMAARLRDERSRMDELTADGRNVAASLAVSYQRLPADLQQAFRLLGVIPGREHDRWTAAALFAVPARDAERKLEGLADAHMVQHCGADRYRLHPLMRQQARRIAQEAEPATGRQEALRRVLRLYLRIASLAAAVGEPTRVAAPLRRTPADHSAADEQPAELGRWLDQERGNAIALVSHLREIGWESEARELTRVLPSAAVRGPAPCSPGPQPRRAPADRQHADRDAS